MKRFGRRNMLKEGRDSRHYSGDTFYMALFNQSVEIAVGMTGKRA